jgi:hypothetical protein
MTLSPTRLLLLLSVLLAGGMAWLWVDEHGQLKNTHWVAPAAMAPDLSGSAKTPANANPGDSALFASILERPLFAPDRRPPPPPAPPPPPDPFADIQLLGIFSGANAGILARVEGKVRRVKMGESVGSWSLKSVEGRDVTFAQGEDSRALRLNYARIDTLNPQAPVKSSPTLSGGAAPAASGAINREDEARDTLRRRNKMRAERGLPLITE